MCMSRPSSPKPVVQAQAAPLTSERPEFETEMAEMETQSDVNAKKKKGKDKLKIAKDPSIAMNATSGTGSSAGSGVNIG